MSADLVYVTNTKFTNSWNIWLELLKSLEHVDLDKWILNIFPLVKEHMGTTSNKVICVNLEKMK